MDRSTKRGHGRIW
uniref:Uncharacterized protein n=1 Tax=Anguilla anguilla TaxID=7936 RepID=A0A0E9UIM2_ANGAN